MIEQHQRSRFSHERRFLGMSSGKKMIRTDSLRGIFQSLDVTFETVQPLPSKYFQIYHPLINLSLDATQFSVVRTSLIRHTYKGWSFGAQAQNARM